MQGYLKLEVIGNSALSTLLNTLDAELTNKRILEATFNPSIDTLMSSLNISIVLDSENNTESLDNRISILSGLKLNQEIKAYLYSDPDYTKDKCLLIDGFVKDLMIDSPASTLNLIIYSKTADLLYRKANPDTRISTRLFTAHIVEFFRKHSLYSFGKFLLADKIVFPVTTVSSINQKNILTNRDKASCYDYLTPLLNDKKLKMNTICLNNKSILYFISNAESITAQTPAFTLFQGSESKENTIEGLSINMDASQIYGKYVISTKSNVSTGQVSKSQTYTPLITMANNGTRPPLLYSNRIKSDVGNYDITEYAKFLHRNQIRSAIKISVQVASLYPDSTQLDKTFNLYQKINIPEEINGQKNIAYYDLYANFSKYMKSLSGYFIVCGIEMNLKTQQTTLDICPASIATTKSFSSFLD
jgi:hypothetical protein